MTERLILFVCNSQIIIEDHFLHPTGLKQLDKKFTAEVTIIFCNV